MRDSGSLRAVMSFTGTVHVFDADHLFGNGLVLCGSKIRPEDATRPWAVLADDPVAMLEAGDVCPKCAVSAQDNYGVSMAVV